MSRDFFSVHNTSRISIFPKVLSEGTINALTLNPQLQQLGPLICNTGHFINFMENHPICGGRAQIADICPTFLLYNCFLEGLLYVKIPSLARLQCPTGGFRWRSLLPPPDVKQYHHHHPELNQHNPSVLNNWLRL